MVAVLSAVSALFGARDGARFGASDLHGEKLGARDGARFARVICVAQDWSKKLCKFDASHLHGDRMGTRGGRRDRLRLYFN